MNFPGIYKEYLQLCDQDLAEIMAGRKETESKANIARLVYEERQRNKQYELNLNLLNKQLRWMKFSAILTAISTLTAAIAGACLTYILIRSTPQPKIEPEKSKIIQPQTRTWTPVPYSERKADKDTLQPSR
jgi:hypothetical protein